MVQRLQQRAREVRENTRPLVWFHAPSVGEGLQARPVIDAVRHAHPDWQIAYTFFSPSAAAFATTIGADIVDYLPFDNRDDMRAVLSALQPSALVFAKLDVWPTLVSCATARGIPVALISATLNEASGRRGWWSRQLLGTAYQSLSAVGAIDQQHANRLVDLGVPAHSIRVTGDTRFDQVYARAQTVNALGALQQTLASPRPTVVVGSSWPADERVVCEAWLDIVAEWARTERTPPRIIIAPHEPTEVHCDTILVWAERAALRVERLSAIRARVADGVYTPAEADVIVVDQVGVLGDLYAMADVAFVGGGFHAAGLHSVIEPAAFGVPVVFGPQHHGSREAQLLLAQKGAFAVQDLTQLRAVLIALLSDNVQQSVSGAAAKDVVLQELGATARSVTLVEQLVAAHGS